VERLRNVPHERSRRHVRAERTPKMILEPIIIFARYLESCHDLCHFRNIQRRDPVIGNVKDSLSLRCIRRARNLDAMWAREPTTVGGNLREVKKLL